MVSALEDAATVKINIAEKYKYEIEYIKKYNTMVPNGYNLTPGGGGGKKHSQETINKISILF